MKLHLGKLFLLIIFYATNSYANLTAFVEPRNLYKNEIVNLTIKATGDDVVFPEINEVAGFPVIGRSSSSSVSVINGEITRVMSKTYSFRVDKTTVIKPINVQINGTVHKTPELLVTIAQPLVSADGDPFVVQLQLSSNSAYVGEPINLQVKFKQRKDVTANKIQLGEPKLDGLWIKKTSLESEENIGDYIVRTWEYKVFPQKPGDFVIPGIEALIGVFSNRSRLSFFGRNLTWSKVYSNSESLTVTSLPAGINLYGDYKISVTVDKKEVKANQPVNVVVQINGTGNIDDVSKFELKIDNAVIYADEPEIKSSIVNDEYQGVSKQKIAIIADHDFIIPSFKLRYFSKKDNSIKTVTTNPIDIRVLGGGVPNKVKQPIETSKPDISVDSNHTKTKTIIKTEPGYLKYLFLFFGVLLGILGYHLWRGFSSKNTNATETNIMVAIRKTKTDKELFDLLVPYASTVPDLTKHLSLLEQNIYNKSTNIIDKRKLLDIFANI